MNEQRTSGTVTNRGTPPRPGPLRPFTFPPIEVRGLENGLQLVHAPSRRMPVVTLSLLVPGGVTSEPVHRSGLAHLTARLLDSGTRRRGAEEIAESFEALGVTPRLGASWDSAFAEVTVLRSTLEPAAELLSELVREPAFLDVEVERVRSEQIAGVMQRRADPRSLANEVATRYLFSDASPYAKPLGGTVRSLGEISGEEIRSFHGTFYGPRAGSLIVAGDLSADEAEALARSAFGAWEAIGSPEPQVRIEPRFQGAEVVLVHRPGAVQSEIRFGHVGLERGHPDYFAVVVMNAILGGAFSSRLNLNLRERHGFTYGVHSSFGMRRYPGPFLVSTAVQTEVTGRAVEEIRTEIDRIRAEPVSDAELRDARNYLAGVFPLRIETTDGIASALGDLALYGLPLSYFEEYPDRIQAVSAEDVLRVATEHLHPHEALVVIAGDADAVRDPVEALGIGPVRTLSAEEVE